MTKRFPSSVALINPLGDYGIDTYTYELGQGLAANGVTVDAYCSTTSRIGSPELSPNHRRFNVLGARLPRRLEDAAALRAVSPNAPNGSAAQASPVDRTPSEWRRALRHTYLSLELALHLKQRRYDAVWTQWPEMDDYPSFWKVARALRLPVVHTVHNILPHERRPRDVALYREVYESARLLFVHSQPVRDELATLFPTQLSKAAVMPHGAYTFYRRCLAARSRVRAALDIPPTAVVLLFCGAIRPYKNIDAAIEALAAIDREDVILVVAGSEGEAPFADPLRRTKELINQAGIEARVRLVPGFLDTGPMGELFEAADVLLLPYLKSYGSGLLMLGITFGKYIVATRSGMEETASRYARSIVLGGPDATAVRAGIETAVERVTRDPEPLTAVPAEFEWSNIAAKCIHEINLALKQR